MSNHDNFGQIFNQAETQMGTDMYQAQVEMTKATMRHCEAESEKAKAEIEAINSQVRQSQQITNSKSLAWVVASLTGLVSSPAVIIFIYKWALGA